MLTQIRPQTSLTELVAAIRGVVDRHADWRRTAELVAGELESHLPGPELLTAEQRCGDPTDYRSYLLYVEPRGSFSVGALGWLPGQATPIHDHLTWCVFGVLQGVEHEELFDPELNVMGENDNQPGDVSGFAPPGDIHRVHNVGTTTAISLHVYGTDISRVGNSVRRYYD